MEYRILGRTGLRVSVCGLGGGGTSRLGLESGGSSPRAVSVVRRGHELGVNYFDSSQSYRTESIFGEALRGHRDEVILSSKVRPFGRDGSPATPAEIRGAVESSLHNFGTDHIDIYHVHHLTAAGLRHCVDTVVPTLTDLRDEGKIRYIGASEHTVDDPRHESLCQSLRYDCWDVHMVAYNLFNQSAREVLLPETCRRGIGVEAIIAARNHFGDAERLERAVLELVERGQIDAETINRENPLGFVSDDFGLRSMAEVSYRMAIGEEGVGVVVVGTGSVAHLEENVRSLTAGPLPMELRSRLTSLFGHLSIAVDRAA